MRRYLYCGLLLLSICWGLPARANHILGGELTYTNVSGSTYRITLTVYGKCADPAFGGLATSAPTINVFTDPNILTPITLDVDPNAITEITPVCAALISNTKCTHPNSTIDGIKKFVYSKVYTLPYIATNWKFVFSGLMGTSNSAGRLGSGANILNPGPQPLYLAAELNNASGPNSSPQFTTIPTPFFCVNNPQEYNQGVVDPDNDQLKFSLSPALNNGNPVTYVSPYSPTYPLSTATGTFAFDTLTGQMSFTPTVKQNCFVVNKVVEYRNGVMVGSTMREMTFLILDDCSNNPSTDTIAQLVDAINVPGNIVNVCVGTPNVSFNTSFSDVDGDSMSLSYSGLPAGATINIQNNNTANPSFQFNWNTSTIPVGLYNFFVTIKESNCPISNVQTKNYTIRVTEPSTLTATVVSSTNCFGQAGIKVDMTNGLLPRVVYITNGVDTIKSIIDTTGSVIDSLPSGNYVIFAVSPTLPCPSASFNLAIADTGTYPNSPQITDPLVYCIGDPGGQLDAVPDQGATVTWYDINGTPLLFPPVVNTAAPGTSYYLINQQKDNCSSKLDTVKVTVSENPDIVVTSPTGAVCIGEIIFLEAAGGTEYTWLPEENISIDKEGRPFIRVMAPASYQLVGKNEFGCRDTVAFQYNDILQCCTFSYPTAFTPNADGHNDTWHPIMYGNEVFYELVILNRWGNKVFNSRIPNEGWDGVVKGTMQEIGTYFFYLKAKCIAGPEEVHFGEFHLLK